MNKEIEKIEVKSYSDTEIITNSVEDLERLYELIKNEKDIIISWTDNNEIKSKIVSRLLNGLRNGTLTLGSEMKLKGENK